MFAVCYLHKFRLLKLLFAFVVGVGDAVFVADDGYASLRLQIEFHLARVWRARVVSQSTTKSGSQAVSLVRPASV